MGEDDGRDAVEQYLWQRISSETDAEPLPPGYENHPIARGTGSFYASRRSRPRAEPGAWERADREVEAALVGLAEQAELAVALVLTSGSPEGAGHSAYVFFEPMADAVVALGHGVDRASISYTADLWRPSRLQPEFERLTTLANRALHGGVLSEAVVTVARATRRLLGNSPEARRRVTPIEKKDPLAPPTPSGDRRDRLVEVLAANGSLTNAWLATCGPTTAGARRDVLVVEPRAPRLPFFRRRRLARGILVELVACLECLDPSVLVFARGELPWLDRKVAKLPGTHVYDGHR